jgi:hypothetical protein
MSYDTIKDGISGIVAGQGFSPSQEVSNFKNVASNEYGRTFILKPLSGNLNEGDDEKIIDRFYDTQTWEIQIAFDRNSNNDIVNLDAVHRAKDALISALDKPSNWTSYVAIQKYQSWEVEETDNYYVLRIKVTIKDLYIYS